MDDLLLISLDLRVDLSRALTELIVLGVVLEVQPFDGSVQLVNVCLHQLLVCSGFVFFLRQLVQLLSVDLRCGRLSISALDLFFPGLLSLFVLARDLVLRKYKRRDTSHCRRRSCRDSQVRISRQRCRQSLDARYELWSALDQTADLRPDPARYGQNRSCRRRKEPQLRDEVLRLRAEFLEPLRELPKTFGRLLQDRSQRLSECRADLIACLFQCVEGRLHVVGRVERSFIGPVEVPEAVIDALAELVKSDGPVLRRVVHSRAGLGSEELIRRVQLLSLRSVRLHQRVELREDLSERLPLRCRILQSLLHRGHRLRHIQSGDLHVSQEVRRLVGIEAHRLELCAVLRHHAGQLVHVDPGALSDSVQDIQHLPGFARIHAERREDLLCRIDRVRYIHAVDLRKLKELSREVFQFLPGRSETSVNFSDRVSDVFEVRRDLRPEILD